MYLFINMVRYKTDLSDIDTGDVLLFNNNTHTGITLRLITGSTWSHIGVVVILKKDGKRWGVVAKDKGEPYLLEVNNRSKVFSLRPVSEVLSEHNLISYRPLKSKYRTKELLRRTREFIKKYSDSLFTTEIVPYLSVFIGTRIKKGIRMKKSSDNTERPSFFCSEFVNYYYMYVLNLDESNYSCIFGRHIYPELTSPQDFDPSSTPNSEIFENEAYVIHRSEINLMVAVVLPLVIGLVIMSVIWFALPGNRMQYLYEYSRSNHLSWSRKDFFRVTLK